MDKKSPIVGVQLDRSSGTPLYSQLYQFLKKMIQNRKLDPGQKLPPIREIARELKINNSTVVQALEALGREGLVYKHVGRGTFVSTALNGFDRDNHGAEIYDFSSLSPSPQLFPISEFKAALNHVLDYYGGEALSYQPHKGYQPLREKMASFLQQDGIDVSPDFIQVISGGQQGIDIAAKVVLGQGETIFLEEPTYPGSLLTFQSRGARIIHIPIDRSGLDFVELEKRLLDFRPRLIYVMTKLQNPTGYSYNREQKEMLLQLAYKYNFYILEDDYLSLLDYKGYNQREPSLKALDRWDRVILLKSFSKVLMPGLRLGFAVLPEELQEKFLEGKYATDISSSGLLQRALYFYLKDDSWEKHLDAIREEFRARYKLVKEFLEKLKPLLYYYDPQGGLFFWVRVNKGGSSENLARLSRERGVPLAPGSSFYAGRQSSPWFRLSFATGEKKSLEKGLLALEETLREFQYGENQNVEQKKRPIL